MMHAIAACPAYKMAPASAVRVMIYVNKDDIASAIMEVKRFMSKCKIELQYVPSNNKDLMIGFAVWHAYARGKFVDDFFRGGLSSAIKREMGK